AVAADAQALLTECDADDHTIRSIAMRAWGLAARWTDGPRRSIELLREAVRHAEAAEAPELIVQAKLSLSGSLAINGQSTEALDVIDAAATMADRPAAARLLTQRA